MEMGRKFSRFFIIFFYQTHDEIIYEGRQAIDLCDVDRIGMDARLGHIKLNKASLAYLLSQVIQIK